MSKVGKNEVMYNYRMWLHLNKQGFPLFFIPHGEKHQKKGKLER